MHRLFLLLVLISSASAQFTPPTYTPSNLFTNAGTTGTALNKLAKLNAANTVVRTATTDTDTALGICVTNCGTTGKSVIQWAGIVSCVFDGATTLGHWVTISSTTAGDCHDAGSTTRPATSQVIGIVTTTNGSGGTYPVNLQLAGPLPISGTGTVTSITLAGTSNQITVSGTCTVTTSGTCTFTLPSGLVLPGTINKLTLTAPATGATVTIVDGKTFTVNKTLTLDGSDGVTVTFPASNATVATLGLTNTFTGRQDSSGAASTAPAKVGTSLPASCLVGDAYFKSDATAGSNFYGCTSSNTWTLQGGGGSGTVTSVTIAGTSNQITVAGTCTITTTGTCTLSLPSGLQIPGTINKLTLTQPATGSTITVLDGKTITVNKTITFDGTDGVTITFPASSATVATLGLTNTFTGRQDASGAASTAPGKVGTSLPGTCTVGDVYFKSDATAGSNWYGCTASNTWTVQGGGGGGSYSGPQFNVTTPPTSFTGSINIGTSSLTSIAGGAAVDVFFQAGSPDQVRGYYNAKPAATYTITTGCMGYYRSSSCGLVLYDSGSTKALVMVYGGDSVFHCFYFSAPATYGGVDQCGQSAPLFSGNIIYYKIVEDGTHRTFYISADGTDYVQLAQVASGTNLSPDSVGIGVDANGTFNSAGAHYQMFSYSALSGVH